MPTLRVTFFMRTIELEIYNDRWPSEFQREVALLEAALCSNLSRAYHIGSTAIKDCCAKPVIDVVLEVVSLNEIDRQSIQLEALGYEAKGAFGITGRRFFQKGGDSRTHHLHAFEMGNPDIDRHRLFVEYMNAHPDKVAEYSALKTELAKSYRDNPEQYSAGKASFIDMIENAAMKWKR